MTTPQLWQALGVHLRQYREERGWNLVDIERHGGPNYKTCEEQECGRIKTVRALVQHIEAFGVDVVDLLRYVLTQDQHPQFTPDVLPLVGKYARTTQDGREALRRIAEVLPYADVVPLQPAPPLPVPKPSSHSARPAGPSHGPSASGKSRRRQSA